MDRIAMTDKQIGTSSPLILRNDKASYNGYDVERPDQRSHAKHGNEEILRIGWGVI